MEPIYLYCENCKKERKHLVYLGRDSHVLKQLLICKKCKKQNIEPYYQEPLGIFEENTMKIYLVKQDTHTEQGDVVIKAFKNEKDAKYYDLYNDENLVEFMSNLVNWTPKITLKQQLKLIPDSNPILVKKAINYSSEEYETLYEGKVKDFNIKDTYFMVSIVHTESIIHIYVKDKDKEN